MKDFLTAQEITILKEAHYDSRFRKQADRIKTILFLNLGFSYGETAKLLMLDEATHPHHNNRPFYGWIYKGEEKAIKTNTGRKRVNLNGALNTENQYPCDDAAHARP